MYERREEIQKKAINGDKIAQYELGLLYEDQEDYFEAVEWFRKSAEQGLMNAQTALGAMYATGRGGLIQDNYKAAKLFQKAALQGEELAIQLINGNFRLYL